jgi:hypothetical protein
MNFLNTYRRSQQPMTQKIKVNFYLDYPKHSYYEIVINPNKESPSSIIANTFQKLYPPQFHSYSTADPEFIHVREGTILHPDKTFSENGITNNHDEIPDIRIRLKINTITKTNQDQS